MKCSDCKLYKTKECYANPAGADWDSAEHYSCFTPKGDKPADISPVDNGKIYEEEKTRADAQERIRKEQVTESGKKISKKKTAIGCGVLLVIVILLAVGISTCLGGSEDSEITLNAEVVYDDGQFTITHNDDFSWTDVEFDLNYETWSSGYTYHANRLDANTIYTVGSMQFAESDGTMFNPFTQKPLKMSIHCKTPDGKDGWWFGSWE